MTYARYYKPTTTKNCWMKGIVHLLGAVLLAPVLLAACAGQEFYEHLPFTEGVVQDYDLDASSRRRLQYFVSDDIHLVRIRGDGRRGVADGRLFDRSRQEIEEIVVTSGTPGIVLASGLDWMAVSFERGGYLYFTSRPQNYGLDVSTRPIEGRYYLYAPDWNGRAGTIMYDNQQYQAVDESWRSFLLVDRSAVSETRGARAILPGRTLDTSRR